MELKLDSRIENIDLLTERVNKELVRLGCARKIMAQIDIALDELFSNVSHYAYGGSVGAFYFRLESSEDNSSITMTLEDEGVPFDPLAHEDPDIKQELAERAIGGLGIFLVKKTMDAINYAHKNGRNVLTITKKIK